MPDALHRVLWSLCVTLRLAPPAESFYFQLTGTKQMSCLLVNITLHRNFEKTPFCSWLVYRNHVKRPFFQPPSFIKKVTVLSAKPTWSICFYTVLSTLSHTLTHFSKSKLLKNDASRLGCVCSVFLLWVFQIYECHKTKTPRLIQANLAF